MCQQIATQTGFCLEQQFVEPSDAVATRMQPKITNRCGQARSK